MVTKFTKGAFVVTASLNSRRTKRTENKSFRACLKEERVGNPSERGITHTSSFFLRRIHKGSRVIWVVGLLHVRAVVALATGFPDKHFRKG